MNATGSSLRVLIAGLTAGGGHMAAASAIQESWRKLRPEDSVQLVDVLNFFSRLHRKLYSDGWVHIATHAPDLWGMVFDRTDDLEVTRRLRQTRNLFPSGSRTRFKRFIREFDPDVVLCTHYLPVEVLGTLKKPIQVRSESGSSFCRTGFLSSGSGHETDSGTGTLKPFVVSVVTDFEVHAIWMAPSVDLYCVAAEESKARLLARGVPSESIVATGIPVAPKFSTRPNVRAVRKALGVRDDLPLLLVLSGGFGMGPVAEILVQLDRVKKPLQVIAVCGRNDDLRRELACREHKHPTRVLGFVSNMHELMAAADLIITKPGGLTVSEALAMGRPLLIANPIPGQESANSDFLLSHGAAVKVNSTEDISQRVQSLLGSRKLGAMRKAAAALGRPDAAFTVCQEVLSRICSAS